MTDSTLEPVREIGDLAKLIAHLVGRIGQRGDRESPRIVVHSEHSLFELAPFVVQFWQSLQSAFKELGQATEILVLDADLLAGTASYERAFALRCFEHLGLKGKPWIQGLKDLPWTLTSAEATRSRLEEHCMGKRWLVFVAGSVDSRELDRAARWLTHCLKARAEVICGDLRSETSDAVPDADWVVRIAAPVLTTERIVESEGMVIKPPARSESSSDLPRRGGWLADIFGRIRPSSATSDAMPSEFIEAEPLPKTAGNSSDWNEWQTLVRRATFPSVLRLKQVHDAMLVAEIRCDMAVERLRKDGNTSEVDEQMLRSRATLLAVLKVQFPDSIVTGKKSWSFEPEIFQIQRSILGRDATLPLWERSRAFDPLLVSLVRQAMDSSAKLSLTGKSNQPSSARALVPPFPSASALRRHIDWLFHGGSPPLRAWEGWLEKHLPVRIARLLDAEASSVADPDVGKVADRIEKEGWAGPDAAMEAGAWLLELIDLERPLDRVAPVHQAKDSTARNRRVILGDVHQNRRTKSMHLLEYALSNSSHGLRLSALLLYARAVALGGSQDDRDAADGVLNRLLADVRQQKTEPLKEGEAATWDLPVQLTRAYVEEVCGDLQKSASLYDTATKQASESYATEVEWRAALGKLRVGLQQVRLQTKDKRKRWNIERSHFIQRAQVLMEVQMARSPHLMRSMKKGELPTVFISYRSKIRTLAAYVAGVINRSARAAAFIDTEDIDQEMEDFSPLIQQRLGSCQAILMVISENYFESPYCSYEWNTIMNRCSLSGYAVPVYWLVCRNALDDSAMDIDASAQLRHLVKTAPDRFAIGEARAQLFANFEDLRERLEACGVPLSGGPQPTRQSPGKPDEWIADEPARKKLDDAILAQIQLLWKSWGSPSASPVASQPANGPMP